MALSLATLTMALWALAITMVMSVAYCIFKYRNNKLDIRCTTAATTEAKRKEVLMKVLRAIAGAAMLVTSSLGADDLAQLLQQNTESGFTFAEMDMCTFLLGQLNKLALHVQSLQRDLEAADARTTALAIQALESSSNPTADSVAMSELQDTIASLEAEIAQKGATIERSHRIEEQLGEKIRSLEDTNGTLRDELAASNLRLTGIKKEFAEVTEARNALQETTDRLRAEIAAMQDKMPQSQQELKDVENDRDTLQDAADELRGDLTASHDRESSLQRDVETLGRDMKTLQTPATVEAPADAAPTSNDMATVTAITIESLAKFQQKPAIVMPKAESFTSTRSSPELRKQNLPVPNLSLSQYVNEKMKCGSRLAGSPLEQDILHILVLRWYLELADSLGLVIQQAFEHPQNLLAAIGEMPLQDQIIKLQDVLIELKLVFAWLCIQVRPGLVAMIEAGLQAGLTNGEIACHLETIGLGIVPITYAFSRLPNFEYEDAMALFRATNQLDHTFENLATLAGLEKAPAHLNSGKNAKTGGLGFSKYAPTTSAADVMSDTTVVSTATPASADLSRSVSAGSHDLEANGPQKP